MKILHILDHSIPLHSGYTFRTKAILEQQRKLGWETLHVTSTKHHIAKAAIEEVDGLTFYRSVPINSWIAKLPILNQWAIVQSLEKRLNDIILQHKPDILQAHSPALNGWAAVKCARKYNIPLVYECRAFWEDAAVDHGTASEGGLRYLLTKMLETYIFKQAKAITTICEGLRTDIISRGIASEKITVIANAVDVEKFTTSVVVDQTLKAQLGLQEKIVLGFIGSFYAYEGLSLLLEALLIMLQKQPTIRLLLVGGGPQEAHLKQKVQELGLKNEVIFTGRINHERVKDYYNQIDILVYPRLSMRLTELVTPLKPLEAMAQGKLVVASDVGGHKELIEQGITGCLFEAGNKKDLANTVLNLLATPECWDDMRKAGRWFVEQQKTWPLSVSRYKNIYTRLIS
jgi:PEP-CTERM/exosortase A-associated glycosyltransferase